MTGEDRGWHDSLVAGAVDGLDRGERERLLADYAGVLAELDGCSARRGEPGCGDHFEHAERAFRVRSLRASDAGDPLWRVWAALADRERLTGQVRRLELLEGLDGDGPPVLESPLLDALGALPEEERQQARQDVSTFAERLRGMLDAARRGVAVAPLYRRPVVEQIGVEAERRERSGTRRRRCGGRGRRWPTRTRRCAGSSGSCA
jgi:hypothetical protein